MKLFCLFLLLICFSFNVHASGKEIIELGLKSRQLLRRFSSSITSLGPDLVTSLKRTLTAGEMAHNPLDNDWKPAFFYSHWLKRLDTTSADGKYKFNSHPDTEFEKCHLQLEERLTNRASKFLSQTQVGVHLSGKVLTDDEMDHVDFILSSRIHRDKPFVKGQIIHLKGITAFPIVLFSLSQEGSNFVNFGTPLHHGFYLQNFADYFDSIALLRDWGAYRDLKIVSIPAGSKVNCRVGLVAPQSFPQTNIRYYRDNLGNVAAESVGMFSLQSLQEQLEFKDGSNSLSDLVEHRTGGELQIMFGYAEKYKVYEAGSLCFDEDGNPKKYLKKKNNRWYKPSSAEEMSHFLDKDYFHTLFQLENILQKMDIFDKDERDEIVRFLLDKQIRK
ncbi:MAG: hypothetical protein K2Q34_07665 [Alphaproteobacteria bacterium]|nr:hypothetical protein [Alphaproteobacteria bacterium]